MGSALETAGLVRHDVQIERRSKMFPLLFFLLVSEGEAANITTARMEAADIPPSLDPGLLQAVLADPVLLQAVDPAVLQAVLVTAAAANLVNTEGESQSELEEFQQVEQFSQFSPEQTRQPSSSEQTAGLTAGLTAGHMVGKLGTAFNLPAAAELSQTGHTGGNNNKNFGQWTGFGSQPARQGKLGASFSSTLEFRHQQSQSPSVFPGNSFNSVKTFPDRKIFGAAFSRQRNVIGPQPRPGRPLLEEDVEIISENKHLATSEKLTATNHLKLNEDNVLRYLRDNPNILQQLSSSSPSVDKQSLVLPPVLPPGPQPGVCSLVTANGLPCDPGLAFSPLTGSCEWPDTLIETGCNPEVVTGFGPCPQHIEDPGLNPAQIYGWPYPKFPVTPDVVAAYNFDAVLAKKYFIVCVPTVYDKLFPRLICCPDYEFFDPFHIDGCIHPPPPPPPPPSPPQYLPRPF